MYIGDITNRQFSYVPPLNPPIVIRLRTRQEYKAWLNTISHLPIATIHKGMTLSRSPIATRLRTRQEYKAWLNTISHPPIAMLHKGLSDLRSPIAISMWTRRAYKLWFNTISHLVHRIGHRPSMESWPLIYIKDLMKPPIAI